MAVGTAKLSRLIAKRWVQAPSGAVTRLRDEAGHGEDRRAACGRGLRRAIGELLVCDYGLAQWVAGG